MKGKTKFQSASFKIGERVSTRNRVFAPAVFPFDKTFSTTNEIFSITKETLSTPKKILLAVEKAFLVANKNAQSNGDVIPPKRVLLSFTNGRDHRIRARIMRCVIIET